MHLAWLVGQATGDNRSLILVGWSPWSRKWIKALFVLNMALVNSVCSEQRTH